MRRIAISWSPPNGTALNVFIRERRRILGLTQEQAALRSGYSRGHWANIERGRFSPTDEAIAFLRPDLDDEAFQVFAQTVVGTETAVDTDTPVDAQTSPRQFRRGRIELMAAFEKKSPARFQTDAVDDAIRTKLTDPEYRAAFFEFCQGLSALTFERDFRLMETDTVARLTGE